MFNNYFSDLVQIKIFIELFTDYIYKLSFIKNFNNKLLSLNNYINS